MHEEKHKYAWGKYEYAWGKTWAKYKYAWGKNINIHEAKT